MKRRVLLVITMILLTLALAVVPALAESGIQKGGPPPKDTPTPTPPTIPDIGELYGDLYVVLRDDDGVPVTDENGCILPIASGGLGASVSEVITIFGGDTITVTAYPGEPFQLPYYTDEAGDLVECELTETMASWVETVDFGRLNLGRAPDAVIDHALDEAITKMNAACAMGLDPSGRIMLEVALDDDAACDDWITIDAPAENLALYIKMMIDGDWIIPEGTTTSRKGGDPAADEELRPVLSQDAKNRIYALGYIHLIDEESEVANLNVDELQLAASLLAGAGDKFGVITLDMVVYINSIYGINQAAGGYFDFSKYDYNYFADSELGPFDNERDSGRTGLYSNRISVGTGCDDGAVYVLQPVINTTYYEPICMDIMDLVLFNDYGEVYSLAGIEDADGNLYIEFTDYTSYSSNVRGFAQAADDSLQVLEYVHNYAVPEALPTP